MDQCYQLCLSSRMAGQLAILHGKTFDFGHCMQTSLQNVVIPALLLGSGSNDFFHFISHSVALILVEGHMVSGNQSLRSSFSGTLTNIRNRMKLNLVLK